MISSSDSELTLRQKLHSETARISWRELQRFYAQGVVLQVTNGLDLIETAVMFAEDNVDALQPLIASGRVMSPSTERARQWVDQDSELWSVVVAPFVLVQTEQDKRQL